MAYHRVGRVLQLPLDSSKSSIEQISCLSSENLTVLCIRTSGSRLQLRCFCHKSEFITVSSLKLNLPKETSNQVISASIVSIFPKLLVNILTLAGTLITIDVSKFLIKGNLPEIIKSECKRNSSTACDRDKISPMKQISLYDLSIGSKNGHDVNVNSISKADVRINPSMKYEQHLPSNLTLEQTLKLATIVEDLGFSEKQNLYVPLCMLSVNEIHSNAESEIEMPILSSSSARRTEDLEERSVVTSFIGCSNGALLILKRFVSFMFSVICTSNLFSSCSYISL